MADCRRQSCFYISLLFPVRLQQVAQIRIVFYAQELPADDVAHLFLDTVVVTLYFLLHMVPAVLSREVRDDGYRSIRPRLGLHPALSTMIRAWNIFCLMVSPKLSDTLPTNIPCERLDILEAGIRESSWVLMLVDVSSRVMLTDLRCWSTFPNRSERFLAFPPTLARQRHCRRCSG